MSGRPERIQSQESVGLTSAAWGGDEGIQSPDSVQCGEPSAAGDGDEVFESSLDIGLDDLDLGLPSSPSGLGSLSTPGCQSPRPWFPTGIYENTGQATKPREKVRYLRSFSSNERSQYEESISTNQRVSRHLSLNENQSERSPTSHDIYLSQEVKDSIKERLQLGPRYRVTESSTSKLFSQRKYKDVHDEARHREEVRMRNRRHAKESRRRFRELAEKLMEKHEKLSCDHRDLTAVVGRLEEAREGLRNITEKLPKSPPNDDDPEAKSPTALLRQDRDVFLSTSAPAISGSASAANRRQMLLSRSDSLLSDSDGAEAMDQLASCISHCSELSLSSSSLNAIEPDIDQDDTATGFDESFK